MKLQILSDLHIDSYTRRGLPAGNIPKTEADLIILAGDMSNSSQGIHWAIKQADKLATPIIYIAGNHEYFDENIESFDDELLRLSENTGVTFLQKNHIDINGIRFLGCTMWTGYDYQSPYTNMGAYADLFADAIGLPNLEESVPLHVAQMMHIATYCMRDYDGIYAGSCMLTPEDVYRIHHDHKNWLQSALLEAEQQNMATVAITHHGVSPLSVSEKYQGHSNNPLFINDFTEWMYQSWSPKLWIHGHVHDAFDYQLGNTRVVVNPRAYPKETSSTIAFDWGKLVEV